MAGATRRPRVSPPTLTIASLIAILAAARLIGGYAADDGSTASERFVARVEWGTWATLAGFSVATFAVMLVLGLSAIIRPPTNWGLAGAAGLVAISAGPAAAAINHTEPFAAAR
jgi:hypothetical protein